MPLKGTKALEAWCQRVTSEYPNLEITNMTSSWRNGLGFCAIIHHHCPHLIDYSSLDPENVFENNQLAFQVAEEHLGIPSLLDPQDMVSCQVLDKLSILTYLAQYYKALHNPAALQLRVRTSAPAIFLAKDTGKMEEANTSITGVAKDKVDVHNNTLVKQTIENVATTHDNQLLIDTTPVQQCSTNSIQDNQSIFNTATAKQPSNATSTTPHVIQLLSSTITKNQPPIYHTPDKQPIISTSTPPPVKQTLTSQIPDNQPMTSTSTSPQVKQPQTSHTPDKQHMLSTSTTPPGKQPLTSHIPDYQPMISTSPPVKQPLICHTPDKQPMLSTSPPVKQPKTNQTPEKQPMISTSPPVKQPKTNQTPEKRPMISTSTTPPVKQPLTSHTPDNQPMLSTSTTPPVKQPLTSHIPNNQPTISTSPLVKQPLTFHTPDKQPMISTNTTPTVKLPETNQTPEKQPMLSTSTTPSVKQPLTNHTPEKEPVISTSTTASVIQQLTNHTPDKQPTIITTSDQLASSSHSPPTKAATPLPSPADRQPGEECLVCGLAVFILERCSAGGGHPLHRACARCSKCGLAGVGSGYRVERGQVVCGLCQGVEGETRGEKKGNACNEDCQKQNVTDAAANHTSSMEIRKGPPPPKPARTFQIKQELVGNLGSSSLAPSARTNIHSSRNPSDPSSPDKKESVVIPSKEFKETETIVKANRETLPNSQRRLEQCNQELFDLDIQIAGLEKQGVTMEKKIRKSLEFQETNDEFECLLDPREDDLIVQLFDLVNEKNELVRKQSEVMFMKKEKMLDMEQVECEEQVRVLLDKSPWLKTESDRLEEELLIDNIIEIVKRRNEIVNHLEMDRIRETEEDSAFSDVKLKLTNCEDLQNTEKKPIKASARKRLMTWISRQN